MLFYPKTSYMLPRYNPIRRIQSKRGHSVKVKSQGQNFPKMGKSPNNLPYLKCYFPTDFTLGTKVRPNKAHSMTHVPITLTFSQGQRSRSKFPKMGNVLNNWLYLAIWLFHPTDFILVTKVQPNKAHTMTQVPMTLTFGQGQRSRSKFPQNG